MIQLHQLKKHPKSVHRRKVVGRGLGSGHGTYSTRGGKGQTARTGHSKMPAAFEGGRQPLVRQLPKSRGFKSLKLKAAAISLSKLQVFNEGDTVTLNSLYDKKILRKAKSGKPAGVKILAGEIKKKLIVKLSVSASARKAIEAAGGSVKS